MVVVLCIAAGILIGVPLAAAIWIVWSMVIEIITEDLFKE